MAKAIMIRVKAENYESWYREHSGQEQARLAYGITDGPFYRDSADPNAALVHLDVQELDQAMGWFKSEAFRSAAGRVIGSVQREMWIAERGMAGAGNPSKATSAPAQ